MGRYVAWPPPEELDALLDLAQQGDPLARDALLTALRPPLLAFFSYRLPPDLAEDLTQLALVRIARAIPRIDRLRADRYVKTVARNLLRSAYRRRAREDLRCAEAKWFDPPDARLAMDLDLEYRELADAVARASASSLSPALARIVIGLMRGETTAEIAAVQRVSPITIRTRLMRARAMLRRELAVFLEPNESSRRAGESSRHGERFRKCRGM